MKHNGRCNRTTATQPVIDGDRRLSVITWTGTHTYVTRSICAYIVTKLSRINRDNTPLVLFFKRFRRKTRARSNDIFISPRNRDNRERVPTTMYIYIYTTNRDIGSDSLRSFTAHRRSVDGIWINKWAPGENLTIFGRTKSDSRAGRRTYERNRTATVYADALSPEIEIRRSVGRIAFQFFRRPTVK